MPRHLNLEAGFDDGVSSLDDTSGPSGTQAKKREAQLEKERAEAKQQKEELGTTLKN